MQAGVSLRLPLPTHGAEPAAPEAEGSGSTVNSARRRGGAAVRATAVHPPAAPLFARAQTGNSSAFKARPRGVATGYTALTCRAGSTPPTLGPGSYAADRLDMTHPRQATPCTPLERQTLRPTPENGSGAPPALGPGAYTPSRDRRAGRAAAPGVDFSRGAVRPGSAPVAGRPPPPGFVPEATYRQERRLFMEWLDSALTAGGQEVPRRRPRLEKPAEGEPVPPEVEGAGTDGASKGEALPVHVVEADAEADGVAIDEDDGASEGGDAFDIDAVSSVADARAALAARRAAAGASPVP